MRYCPQCGLPTDQMNCEADGTPTVRRVASVRGDLSSGEVVGGRYRVVRVLGRGGFGTVYEAEHVTTGHPVALKILVAAPGSEGDELSRRFFQEAATTSRLSHPNTVRVFDFGQSERGDLFLAMERLVGETLMDLLARFADEGGPMPEDDAIEIGVAILRSLGEAHAHGLVHRDLKPANIFLHQVAGGEAIVKVLDFGIVKDVDANMTQAGKALGTPTHMSPEQAMGKAIDGRSDLYALGVLLYECLSGSLPFFAESPLAIVMMHVTQPVQPLALRCPGVVRPSIARVVEKALAKDPNERWADATAMRVALQHALREPWVVAGPAAAPEAMAPPAPVAPAARRPPSRGEPSASVRVRLPPRARPWNTQIPVDSVADDEVTGIAVPAMVDDEPVDPLSLHRQPTIRLDRAIPPDAPATPVAPAAPAAAAAPTPVAPAPSASPAVTVPAPSASPAATRPAPSASPAATGPASSSRPATPVAVSAAAPAEETFFVVGGADDDVDDASLRRDAARERLEATTRRSVPSQGGTALEREFANMRDHIRGMGPSAPMGGFSMSGSPRGFGDLSALVGGLAGRGGVDRMSQDLMRMSQELHKRQPVEAVERRGQVAAMWMGDDLRTFAIGLGDGQVRLLHVDGIDGNTQSLLDRDSLAVIDHESPIIGLGGVGDGEFLVSVSLDRRLRLSSVRDGALRAETKLDATPTSLCVSTDSRLLVVGFDDGAAALYELPDLQLRRTLRGHREALGSVAIAGSRRSMATGSDDGTVRTWDPIGGGARLTQRGHGCKIGAVAMSRDARFVASAGWDGRLLVWSARTGEVSLDVQAHADVVAGIAWSLDSDCVATASDDRSVRVWRVADRRELAERGQLGAGAKWLRWAADGHSVVAATWGGDVVRVPSGV